MYAGNKRLDHSGRGLLLGVFCACRLPQLPLAPAYTEQGQRPDDHGNPVAGLLLGVRPLKFIGSIEDQSFVVFLFTNIHISLVVKVSEAYFPLLVYCPCALKQVSFSIGSAAGKV